MISSAKSKGGDAPEILVFAPHPDDDVLGCGGAIAWHAGQGHRVTIVYLTSGESGSLEIPKLELGVIREKEAREAAAVLGAAKTMFMGWPDGYLEMKPEYLQALTALVREIKPRRAYLPHDAERVRDHAVAHQLAFEAVRRAGGPWFQECRGSSVRGPWAVREVFGFEVWTPIQAPSVFLDISAFMDLKLKALREHKSQLANQPYDEAVTGLNRYRGVMGGNCKYCECFQVIKAGFEG
jgi:N-acetylglucosamine malate deacetylase 1